MRTLKFAVFFGVVIFCLTGCMEKKNSRLDLLKKEFLIPPHSARPWVFWINMDGHLTKEGITADLESMKEVGIGGVLFMDVDVDVPRGNTPFLSESWKEAFVFAIQECERLGMEFITITGPGWTGTGGPWIRGENSMQHLIPASVELKGPAVIDIVLPKPQPRISPYHMKQTPDIKREIENFYEDVAVFAFPSKKPVIEDIYEKALYVRRPYTSEKAVRPYLPSPLSYSEPDSLEVIHLEDILDLTHLLEPDGSFKWQVPAGDWTIVRLGVRSTGANGRPAPLAGLGLESDKFSKAALKLHFENYFDPLLEKIGPRPMDRNTGFTGLDADSWEMNSQNWTAGFVDEFKKRFGYDPWYYFPAYTGRIVESREKTERFLWDVRMLCQDLLLENHISYMRDLCHERGLKLYIEPYDMNPTNDLNLGSYADIPMGEFWYNHFNSAFSCIEAASIGHIMGKPIVAAEAFTAYKSDWKVSPAMLKNQGDWAFATGINRFVTVTFSHQPWLDKEPGMMFASYGLHWERTQTFWRFLKSYNDYIARCSHLLQQGVTVSDILYLTPEGAPHVFRPPASAMTGFESRLPDKKGYSFDGCSPEILLSRAECVNGHIAFPDGSSYKLLVLPEFNTMTPELLSRILELVKEGATVIGNPPQKSPSLANYPACDSSVKMLVRELWGDNYSREKLSFLEYGSGKIYFGNVSVDSLYADYSVSSAVLKDMGVQEDFVSDDSIRYTHRRDGDIEIYFLSNKSSFPCMRECRFRMGAEKAEIWDPLTGETKVLSGVKQNDGIAHVNINFGPHQSYFVVFAKDTNKDKTAETESFPEKVKIKELNNGWQVYFDTLRGGPGRIFFKSLQDWSTNTDKRIKYYSGTARYSCSFHLDELPTAKKIYLDLGTVHELAAVRLNGEDLGIIWCDPWQIEVTEDVSEGENLLEIEVANLWVNRLIGDSELPPGKSYTYTILENPYNENSKLSKSGLLGPVKLMSQ